MNRLLCAFLLALVCFAEPKTTVNRFTSLSYATASGFNGTASWFFNAFNQGVIEGRPATYISFNLCDYPNGDFTVVTCYSAEGLVLGYSLSVKSFESASLTLPDLKQVSGLSLSAYTGGCDQFGNCTSNPIPFPSIALQGYWKVNTATALFGYSSETFSGNFERVVPFGFGGVQRTTVTGTQRKTGTDFTGAFGALTLSTGQGEMFLAQGSSLTVTSSKTLKQ